METKDRDVKRGNSFPCGYILMWPVHFLKEVRSYCWEYHLVSHDGTVISSQFKSYLRIKIITSLFLKKKFFFFCSQTLDSSQVARVRRPGRSWVISFLVSSPEENCGRKWHLKMSTMNNLSWILISVKFRISVPSLFKHVWYFGNKARESRKRIEESPFS